MIPKMWREDVLNRWYVFIENICEILRLFIVIINEVLEW